MEERALYGWSTWDVLDPLVSKDREPIRHTQFVAVCRIDYPGSSARRGPDFIKVLL